MKFLQIGDLHLGKKLYEVPLVADQRAMLKSIIELLQAGDYDALFITGDIYEQSLPSHEAINLFSDFLQMLNKRLPNLSVYIIPGNHDSAVRLGYGQNIFEQNKIYIRTTFSADNKPFILENKNERIAIHLLPFLQQVTVSAADNRDQKLLEQKDIIAYAVECTEKNFEKGMPNILLAHLFTLPHSDQGKEPDMPKQDSYVGLSQLVPHTLFKKFDYVALGHIHKYMKISDRIYYAGSPFAYSFDEAFDGYEKYALKIELDCNGPASVPKVTKLAIPQLHRLRTITGEFYKIYSDVAYNDAVNDYLQIELINSAITESPMQTLQKRFPLLMHIKQQAMDARGRSREYNFTSVEQIAEHSFEELYKMFIAEIGSETDDDEISLAKEFWQENT